MAAARKLDRYSYPQSSVRVSGPARRLNTPASAAKPEPLLAPTVLLLIFVTCFMAYLSGIVRGAAAHNEALRLSKDIESARKELATQRQQLNLYLNKSDIAAWAEEHHLQRADQAPMTLFENVTGR